MNDKFVINVGRQPGSGGRQIGEELASQFKIAFYDKELINLASKESGLGKEFFEKADEKKSHSIIGGLLGLRTNFSNEVYVDNYLSNETFFKIQSDIIRELAKEKSCVFVGRCADYILRDHPCCINVFITADVDDRLKRLIALDKNLTVEKAYEMMNKMDKKRSEYYNYFSNKVWGAAESYHLCINSSVLGIHETVTYIRQFIEKKLLIS